MSTKALERPLLCFPRPSGRDGLRGVIVRSRPAGHRASSPREVEHAFGRHSPTFFRLSQRDEAMPNQPPAVVSKPSKYSCFGRDIAMNDVRSPPSEVSRGLPRPIHRREQSDIDPPPSGTRKCHPPPCARIQKYRKASKYLGEQIVRIRPSRSPNVYSLLNLVRVNRRRVWKSRASSRILPVGQPAVRWAWNS